mmetsp:Transcript_23903/g.36151  ORF Transcript_23903/g.36151 Transcript_23903/m.36151 type:complete len:156 (+) Transcript_23903:134-601(+)
MLKKLPAAGSEFPLSQTLVCITGGCVITGIVNTLSFSKNLAIYIFASWQITFGLALIFQQAKVYGASSIKQAQRVAEMAGLSWVLFGILSVVAAWEDTLLATSLILAGVTLNGTFSVLAGPYRLTPASEKETFIVPCNTVIVSWVASTMLIEFTH